MICGDLNVARTDRDVHAKERKAKAIGQQPEERDLMSGFSAAGSSTSAARSIPDRDDMFTWWPPWRNMRQRNIGWRIDYIFASAALASTRDRLSRARRHRHERPRSCHGHIRY